MGSFDSIANLFSDLGLGLASIIQNPNALYAAYFIAFYGIIYWTINIGLSKAALFKEQQKAKKVISVMVSIIVIGSVFYRYRNIEDLLQAMGGFIGTIAILAIGIFFGWLGFSQYNKRKESNKLVAVIYLSLCTYIASSLILPLFGTVTNFSSNTIEMGQNTWLYTVVISKFGALRVIGDMLAFIQGISAITLIVSVIWLPFSLVKGAVSGMDFEPVNKTDKATINKVREAIDRLNGRINKIDKIFKRMKDIFRGG